MRAILLILFMTGFVHLTAQVQFSVVCNNNENKVEVILSTEMKPHHTILKDRFPNQRVAEKYVNDNRGNLNCGPRPPVVTPPPTTADRGPSNTSSTGGGTTPLRQGAKYYDKHFIVKGSLGKVFGLDKIYLDNVETSNQSMGYDLGVELFYGKAMKGGLGFHYTALYGGLEDMLLDVVDDFPEFYGKMTAFRAEALMKSPIRAGKHSWVLVDFGFNYYFNVKSSLDEDIDDILIPEINEQLYGIRWGLGVDYKGLILFVDGEIMLGITDEDYVEKENFFRLKGGMGYAF